MLKNCVNCGESYEIKKEDLAFYKDMDVSAPTHCYLCRMQRRLSYRNERHLYHRKCDLTGKQIISSFSVDKPFPVYDLDAWWSDAWDPLSHGQDFDFSRPFFQQFFEVRNRVPRQALQHQKPMVNSNYCNCASRNKNCYLVFSTNECEDCYYGSWVNKSKDCIDNLTIEQCELCYESMDSRNCYRCMYVQDCDTCSDCTFSSGLRGCTSCIGCHGLVQKKYCAFNGQLTETDWKTLYGSMRLTRLLIGEIQKRSEALRLATPQRFASLVQCENVTGDRCTESRNCREVFDCNTLEDCAYCFEISDGLKDSRDCSVWGERAQLFYECQAAGTDGFHCLFCDQIWRNNRDLYYCIQCFPGTTDCFGCFSLHNHRYCILNKQYTKEEYESLVPQIISHMRSTGEWGEFFPVTLSDYAYNQTIAQEFFPLTKEEVTTRGWRWYEETGAVPPAATVSLPDDIADVNDAICDTALTCAVSGKPYKLIKQELAFYRTMGIPIPALSPDQRHKHRMQLRRPLKLWDRKCMQCGKAVKTNYAPDRPEIVYCEECYLKEVY